MSNTVLEFFQQRKEMDINIIWTSVPAFTNKKNDKRCFPCLLFPSWLDLVPVQWYWGISYGCFTWSSISVSWPPSFQSWLVPSKFSTDLFRVDHSHRFFIRCLLSFIACPDLERVNSLHHIFHFPASFKAKFSLTAFSLCNCYFI